MVYSLALGVYIAESCCSEHWDGINYYCSDLTVKFH